MFLKLLITILRGKFNGSKRNFGIREAQVLILGLLLTNSISLGFLTLIHNAYLFGMRIRAPTIVLRIKDNVQKRTRHIQYSIVIIIPIVTLDIFIVN